MRRGFARLTGVLLVLLLVIAQLQVLSPQQVLADDVGEVVDLVLSPNTQTVNPGETFVIAIEVQGNGQDITGLSAYLDYKPDYLEVLSVAPGTSELNR